jgi:hypothetical protein
MMPSAMGTSNWRGELVLMIVVAQTPSAKSASERSRPSRIISKHSVT